MTTGAQVELGVRAGYADATSCKIAVASLVAGDITVSGSWGLATFVFTPAAIGTAGYTGGTIITGLSPFTRYSYTVTQGSKSSSGSFMTAPGDADDFSIFFVGCDCNTVFNDPAGGGHVTGFWNEIRAYAQNGALPTAGLFFVDDHGYVDYCKADDTGYTGLKIAGGLGPAQNGAATDYAVAYICNLGMLGNGADPYIAWGRDEDRVWCNQNINYLPQWGDHEFINDFGWDSNYNTSPSTLVYGGTSSATNLQIWTGGKAAWDAFMTPLMPPLLAGGYGWAYAMGCVNLIAPDGITNCNGMWSHGTNTPQVGVGSGEPTVLFGNTQIDAILGYLNTPANQKPFNLFGMANSIRYLSSTVTVYQSGAQHPIYDHILPEYQRLFTADPAVANPQPSLMKNNATNGINGVTVLLHGDYHHACVMNYSKPAYTDNLAENFYSVYLGTISGSTNFTMPIAEGTTFNDTTLEYDSGWINPQHDYAGLRVDVYGSKSKPEIHIHLLNMAGNSVWSRKWYAKSGNQPVPLPHQLPGSIGTSRKSSV